MNGNIGTISNGSSVNSGVLKCGSVTPKSSSLSTFGKTNALLSQRDKGQNKSLKGSHNFENQLVLKAAMFVNIQKSNENFGEETKKDSKALQSQFRRNSDGMPREADNMNTIYHHDSDDLSIDSSELNDFGDENVQVQACNPHAKRMSPKRKTFKLARFHKQISRSLNQL